MWFWVTVVVLILLGFGMGFSLYQLYVALKERRQIQSYIVESEKALSNAEKNIKDMRKYIDKSIIPAIQKNKKLQGQNQSKIKNNESKIEEIRKNDTQRV